MEQCRYWWMMAGLLMLALSAAGGKPGDVQAAKDRSERGAKDREVCRYVRGAWSECDPKTNVRSRSLTLKRGDPASCERAKTIQKKCKKACRYEKSSWSECSATGESQRIDVLKANSDPTCDQSRHLTKKCNKSKQVKAVANKGRRIRQ